MIGKRCDGMIDLIFFLNPSVQPTMIDWLARKLFFYGEITLGSTLFAAFSLDAWKILFGFELLMHLLHSD